MVESQVTNELDIAPRVYGRRFVDSLHAEHGLGWVPVGYLRLGHGPADIEAFERSLGYQGSLGVTDAELLSPVEIERRWPDLVASDRAGGLFGASDGYLDGHEYCELMVRLVRSAGVVVRPGTRLHGATRRADDVWVLETSAGAVEVDVVVNASGPWAGVVGDLLDAPVPLEPQQHGATVVNVMEDRASALPFVMDLSDNGPQEGLYFRPEGKTTLIAGIHAEQPGQNVRLPDSTLGRVGEAEVTQTIELLMERLRGIEDAAVASSWTGLYPVSPDLLPLVGPHPARPTVVCALGPGGSGIQLSPAIGLLAAASVACDAGDLGALEGLRAGWAPARLI